MLVGNDGLVILASTFIFKLLHFLLKQKALILLKWYMNFDHK